jgi:hypothetical protein
MTISIKVTACDNELFLIAGTKEKSYLLANIKSGNNKTVDYTLDVENGQFGGTKNVGEANHSIHEKNTTYIPPGTYNLIILGADWGGNQEHFDITLTGGTTAFNESIGPKPSKTASGWAPSTGKFTIS